MKELKEMTDQELSDCAARIFLPCLIKLFEDPDVQKEFIKWKGYKTRSEKIRKNK
jgi:hypothetical protein